MSWLGIYAVFPITLRDHLYQFTHLAGLPRCTQLFLTGIWFACMWIIWKERNDRIFKNAASHPYALFEKVKLHSFLWVKAKHPSFSYCYYDWWKHPLLYGCSLIIIYVCFVPLFTWHDSVNLVRWITFCTPCAGCFTGVINIYHFCLLKKKTYSKTFF
jgi:hypothetical protein